MSLITFNAKEYRRPSSMTTPIWIFDYLLSLCIVMSHKLNLRFSDLRNPNYFLIVGVNNRNVINTYRSLGAPV